jgi:hypothetical protein
LNVAFGTLSLSSAWSFWHSSSTFLLCWNISSVNVHSDI